MRTSLLIGAVLACAVSASASACSSSDSPPAGAPVSIVGSWGGSLDDCMDGCLGSVTASFDDLGQFSYDYNSGATSYSGTYQRVAPQIFLLTESGGLPGVVVSDASGTHVGILHSFNGLQVGVMEKGAGGPAGGYALSDLYGTWAGAGFVPDDSYTVVTPFTATATITAGADAACHSGPPCAAYDWSDTSGFSLSSNVPAPDATYGNGYESTDEAFYFLTPDRNFLGVIFCTTWPGKPSDCRVEGVARQ